MASCSRRSVYRQARDLREGFYFSDLEIFDGFEISIKNLAMIKLPNNQEQITDFLKNL